MPMYSRSPPTDPQVIDRWDGGVGWIAHPEEGGRRASHAVRGNDGVWLFDPIDAPGVDDLIADLGDVAGVAVLSSYHARDAGAFARRHDVSVRVPGWVNRVDDRIDAPITRIEGSVAGFELRELRPLRAWREAVAYREADGTLYVPDFLTTLPTFTVDGERIAMNVLNRLAPPRGTFEGLSPDRILFGHGGGVFEDATAALSASLANARRRFPRALLANGVAGLRAMVGAIG
ncbi:hypothetical protein G9464_05250 [Halostella sp. JP-L12]|uniref:hypothetical protein n=1 Tax=Halostella TaxID=1843185 RepID=UPI000EF78127|nr:MULTISPECIES: hypothetical protein [Halostella]NHN47002.1 hypothetical protein [Halostella sp. JP-L12]